MARRNLQGKRVILTGASSGIGRGLAVALVKKGAHVLATARDEGRLDETATLARKAAGNNGGRILTITGELTDADDRSAIIQAADSQLGGLDLLINNAGIGATGHFQYAEEERLRKIFDVNFFAPLELTRSAIPLLKQGHDPAIVMINSVAGRIALAARSEYSASKFALAGFTDALRAELAKDDIQVTQINPGLTQSNFETNMIENNARLSVHQMRSMSADECAELIISAIERRKSEVTFTRKGWMMVLAARLFPAYVRRRMAREVRKLWAKEIQERKSQMAHA